MLSKTIREVESIDVALYGARLMARRYKFSWSKYLKALEWYLS